MRPVLMSLNLGGRELALHGYGVLVAVGFAAGIVLAFREARRQGMDGGQVLDLSFWILVAGLAGSRLLYVLLNARELAADCVGRGAPRSAADVIAACARPLFLWEGGLVFYGGVAAAAGATAIFVRRRRWSFWRVADIFAPSLALGHFFGRLGCFAAGCCFGKTCIGAWGGVHFPAGSVAFDELTGSGLGGGAVMNGLHPTQLYEAAGDLGLFFLLILARQRTRRSGEIALGYALAYAAVRVVIEMFRGDSARRFVGELGIPALARALALPPDQPLFLSVSQTIGLLVLAAAITTFWVRRRAVRKPVPLPPSP